MTAKATEGRRLLGCSMLLLLLLFQIPSFFCEYFTKMKTPKVFVSQQFQQEIANHTNSGYSIASFDYHSHKSNKKALFQNKRVEKQHCFAKRKGKRIVLRFGGTSQIVHFCDHYGRNEYPRDHLPPTARYSPKNP